MWSPSDPTVGFWLPIGLLCLATGFWLTDRKDIRSRLSVLVFFTAVILIVLFGVKTRGDDSSETVLLAVFLHMVGPVSLMAIGSLIATFSGPSPVGPLPGILRPLGFLMAIGGLLWIGLMLISQPPDAIANGIGQTIWGAWVDVFISILILVSALAGSFCVMMGDKRHKEGLTLAALAIGGVFMFNEIMKNGSEGFDAAGWHEIHWEFMMFLVGTLFGMFAAIIGFISLVYIAEKRAPDPGVVAPLSQEEKSVVDAVLRMNLEQGGESE